MLNSELMPGFPSVSPHSSKPMLAVELVMYLLCQADKLKGHFLRNYRIKIL